MTDPDLIPTPTRHELARQRRALRRRRVLYGMGIVALVVVVALVATDTFRLPQGKGPSLARGASIQGTIGHQGRRSGAAPKVEHRPLTPQDPLRLWIGGDSLAGSLGPSLGQMTAATGVVQPQYLSRVGSGLLSDSWDWPKKAMQEMATVNPEVAVFLIGTNDAVIFNNKDADRYAQKVEDMMTILVGDHHREVFWIGAPVVKDKKLNERVKLVNAIQAETARKFPDVTFVDDYEIFDDDANGDAYTPTTVDPVSGKKTYLRAGDGIHFTAEGGDLLATAIFTPLDAEWNITKQAVPDQPKQVIASKGSTQVQGTYRSSGSSSGSGNGSSRRTYSTTTTTRSHSTGTTSSTAPPATTPTTSSPPPSTTPTTASPPPSTTPTTAAGGGAGG
jgi:hypothetical protein